MRKLAEAFHAAPVSFAFYSVILFAIGVAAGHSL
jgi:hypothetical protein